MQGYVYVVHFSLSGKHLIYAFYRDVELERRSEARVCVCVQYFFYSTFSSDLCCAPRWATGLAAAGHGSRMLLPHQLFSAKRCCSNT